MKNLKGFTLLEIIIVVILLSIIAGFAIPSYNKSMRRTHEQDAVVQLTALHVANELYEAQADQYLQGAGLSLTQVNNGLHISIMANEMTYSYTSGAGSYAATSSWNETGTSHDFTLRVNQTTISSSNPCCSAGTCPTVANCS
ncbi:MAG: prepilin-type N-terminal cleavage/methylation domain-containing protein [Candidatus Omnitrophica bacterium]|nr:prepilin-type N-terminal cleavage/methylation domain-containing protein [Candidatus Omnitrophota bacterium]